MNKENESRVGFVSLGCPKALVDSERILSQLRAEGYVISPSYQEADLVVVNTCGFIDAAVKESLDAIGEALAENGKVIVTGCLGARQETILDAHPDVLAISGPQAYESVMSSVHQYLPKPHDPHVSLLPPGGIKLTPRHYAYLKISEGCNHACTFCIIPSMRGKLVSRPVGDIMDEAEKLVEAGVRELLVVSQDTSAYGVDKKYVTNFWNGRPLKTRASELAAALGELPVWTRLHYVYPYPTVDELIPLMADGHILPYLDMPLQHGSTRILKAMRRPAATEKVLDRLSRWRQQCPDLTVRSTFIVGFPGETDEDFEQLLDFMREARMDRVGCFEYSPVDGASANELPNAVPDDVKSERYAAFMALQAAISAQKLSAKIGAEMTVLVDDVQNDCVVARGPGDAPEIDGTVIVEGEWDLQPGDFINVKITAADEHDLWAVPVDIDDE